MKRRTLLSGLLTGLAVKPALATTEQPATPGQVTGPFYPQGDIPIRPDLTRFDGGTSQGRIIDLRGRVIDRSGQVISDAQIVFWQSDAQGIYRHTRDRRADQIDPHFAGYGGVNVDALGRYRLRTILPVPYTGRPPHIHARVLREGREVLTTQIYLDGQEAERNLFFRAMSLFSGNRDLLTIAPSMAGSTLAANFDFVLRT